MRRHHASIWRAMAAAVVAFGLIDAAAAQSTIKIGAAQPLTGAFAAAGTDVVNGAKIAADKAKKEADKKPEHFGGQDTPSALALAKVGPDGDGEAYAAEKKKHRWG